MKTALGVILALFTVIVWLYAGAGAAPQAPAERVAADVQKQIPQGWNCILISEKGKMGHPHGLEEPLFRLDFFNTNLAFREETKPGDVEFVHPNLRLHFHDIAERERILKTIEGERVYSWDIPILFAETKEFIIVTSPLWQNNYTEKKGDATWVAGVGTQDANKAIAPLLEALRRYFDATKRPAS